VADDDCTVPDVIECKADNCHREATMDGLCTGHFVTRADLRS
jgi:hypothetical protein